MLGCRGSGKTETTSSGVSILLVVLEWLQLLWMSVYCATGKVVSNDAQKRAFLLHVASMDFQEIYFT